MGKKVIFVLTQDNLYNMIYIIYLKERGTYYALS